VHNLYRKFQHRRSRRASGGVALYYRDALSNGISIIKNRHDTLIWIKLDKVFFNLDNDIYICGVYLWGDDSPAYNTVNIDLFECLEYDITYYESKGSVYLIGDLNSRIGDIFFGCI
jgi:hypothetical protein